MTKTIKRVIAGISALAIIAGAAVGGWAINEYVIKDNQFTITDQIDGGDGGMIVDESTGNGISLMSAKIAAADYDEYGISPMAETAQRLTATITPADADNKAVDWAVAWKNPSSAWASGKTVADYVTVTPTSDGALTANAECLKAFGEQIVITVTSRDNAEATASCTADYVKRVTNATVSIGGGSSIICTSAGNDYDVNLDTTFSDGTLTSNVEIVSIQIGLSTDVIAKIRDFAPILSSATFNSIDITEDSSFVSSQSFIDRFFNSTGGIMTSQFRNAFKSACAEVESSHAHINLIFKNSYNDLFTVSDTVQLQVKFDLSALKTNVTGLSGLEDLIF